MSRSATDLHHPNSRVWSADRLAVRSALSKMDVSLTMLFVAATLCCDAAEEARTLIPSLEGKISDDELQAVLDEISKLRDFS